MMHHGYGHHRGHGSEEEDILGKAYDRRLMGRLFRYVRPYRRQMVVATVLLLFISVLALAGPYLTKLAIDQYIEKKDFTGLWRIGALFVGVLIAEFVLRYGQGYLLQWIGQRVMYDLRLGLFRHLQEMPISFFDRNPVGRLMTRLTGDVQNLNEVLTSGLVTALGDIITLVAIIVIMLVINWRLALVSFIVLPLLGITTSLFRARVRVNYRLIRARIARINAYMQEEITGISVVKLFGQQERRFAQFDELNRLHLAAMLKTIFYYAIFFPAVEIISAIAVALVVWRGGASVLAGTLTLGSLVAFLQYVERFYRPVRDLSEKYNIMQDAMASSERIFGLIDTPAEVTDPPNPIPLPTVRGDVRFDDVWLAYKNEDYVLKGISFRVRPGERVAIVGATGAGKTSIASLLTRLYDVSRGRITIDGIDIRSVRQADLRRHIGLVMQDVFLFSGSIASNIRLGEPTISREEIEEAARFVNAHHFITKLPGGYDGEVTERGSTLSGGQRQLLALARVLADNPEMLLVLDEATSSVDTATEALIQEGLAKVMRGRTSIVIAHRLSTIRNVDRIIVLHKGRIEEEGTHAELLRRRGLYYKLHQLQLLRLHATGS
jgi:ATP-binding cassette subfamily B multidrug efflux pump